MREQNGGRERKRGEWRPDLSTVAAVITAAAAAAALPSQVSGREKSEEKRES